MCPAASGGEGRNHGNASLGESESWAQKEEVAENGSDNV